MQISFHHQHKFTAAMLSGLLSLALLLVGCGRSKSDAANIATKKDEAETAAVAVTTAAADARDIAAYLQATGSFIANEVSDVAPETAGQVRATPVDVGAFVRQGAVIARLDDRDARLRLQQARAAEQQAVAALRQAQARLGLGPQGKFNAQEVPEVLAARQNYESAEAQARLAEAEARRYANLVETGDVSRSVYDQKQAQADTARAQANAARQQLEVARNTARLNNQGIASAEAALANARAQVALAQKAVNDTVIRAPISGHISDRPAAVGEFVTTAAKIATIQRLNPIKLQLQLPEADAGRVRIGLPVSVGVAAYPERRFSGRVTAINPALDPASRSMIVEAELQNPGNQLRPHMFANARIDLPGGERGVFVPAAAVVTDEATNSARVFVVTDGRARVRVVRASEQEDGMVRIVAGVAAGEVVATSNLDKLFDGAVVARR
jgi:multidrug efflux pump subunit AcrA (membrane-fusion protein)